MNNTQSNQIGGVEYLMENFHVYFPYTFISGLVTVTGTIGNLIIMGAIIQSKELQTTTNALIFNLALSDLLISSIVDSFTVVGN